MNNKYMKILFIVPRSKTMFGEDTGEKSEVAYPHVGISYLVAYLKLHLPVVKISIFDEGLDGDKDNKNLKNIIAVYRPDIIGITTFSYNYKYFYTLIKNIKKFTKIPIILGGPHVSAMRKKVLEETKADYAVKGEGEITLVEFLKEFQKKSPKYSKIDGLIWIRKGKIVENKDRVLIGDINILPFPSYEAFDLNRYLCSKEKILPLITSRGCPYGCNYCSVRLSMGRGFRARSPDNVLAEIEHWYNQGFNRFEINDDCFTLDIKRAEQICDLIIKKKLKITYNLFNGIRVDRVTKPLLIKMKKSGCIFISYGCETGNNETLKTIGKGINLEQVKKAVKITNEVGIKNAVNFIIGHVDETYEKALDSIYFAKSLPASFVNFYNLIPYPGTDIFNWIKRNGKFLYPVETYLRDISYRDAKPVFETKEFTRKERIKVLKKGFNLYEKRVIQFRLGKYLGGITYLLTRYKPISTIIINFGLYNKIGRKILIYLSSASRK